MTLGFGWISIFLVFLFTTTDFSCSFFFFFFSNRQFFSGPDDQRLHKIEMKTDKEKEKGRERARSSSRVWKEERKEDGGEGWLLLAEYPREQKPSSHSCFMCMPSSCIVNPYLRVPVILVPSPDFPRFPFLPTFSKLAKRKGRDERRKERSVLSFSLSYLISFASIVRCISRVVECKLLRAWGWFTANWFVNVVFTPLETPIFLPFLGARFGSRRELPGSVVTWPSFLTSSSRIKRPGRVWMADFV